METLVSTLKLDADVEYENTLKYSEKACVGQRLLYPMMEKNNTLPR